MHCSSVFISVAKALQEADKEPSKPAKVQTGITKVKCPYNEDFPNGDECTVWFASVAACRKHLVVKHGFLRGDGILQRVRLPSVKTRCGKYIVDNILLRHERICPAKLLCDKLNVEVGLPVGSRRPESGKLPALVEDNDETVVKAFHDWMQKMSRPKD